MKTYVLTVSEYFPKGHIHEGQPTDFIKKIKSGEKIHTIRANYDSWKKKIDEVNAGKAILSIRTWSGKPYNSKQVIQIEINKVGIQSIEANALGFFIDRVDNVVRWASLAKNDGLAIDQFASWFKKHNWRKKAAIIHFTDFKY